ncbi:MAG: ubiquinone/menaquinone biosynthesis methyltransferase [Candidatus Caenarcaniphilales bacterium]|jgi:demethylmenaquinone methyltransferase/2-methoxy-6-polyprenyl-1,4-benzoquinol methylase|nr:ubiquinone/menaquinone biosynthesis methyltransferase [Candidatus Caenarcaniphilales bacterium]
MSNKSVFVHNLFSRIAEKYDLLNDIMTLSLHRKWKNHMVASASKLIKSKSQVKILDLCTGTGDIADIWITEDKVVEVIAIDSCAPMLESGYNKLSLKYKGPPPKLRMLEADALEIPFPHEYFDAITISFGLRNVNDIDACLKEIFRVLKPGGVFACLDLGHPPLKPINWFYKEFFLKFIPGLGSKFANDKDAYQYLIDSLNTWPEQKQLGQKMYDVGFKRSYFENIMLGAIALTVSEK